MACFQPLIEAQNNKVSADGIPLIFRQFYVTLMATPYRKSKLAVPSLWEYFNYFSKLSALNSSHVSKLNLKTADISNERGEK